MGRGQTGRVQTQAKFSSSEEVSGQEQTCEGRYSPSASPDVLLVRAAGLEICCSERSVLSFLSVLQIKAVMTFKTA